MVEPAQNLLKRSVSSLLPTNKKTWDLYSTRNSLQDKYTNDENNEQNKVKFNESFNQKTKFQEENHNDQGKKIVINKSITSFSNEELEKIGKFIDDENGKMKKINKSITSFSNDELEKNGKFIDENLNKSNNLQINNQNKKKELDKKDNEFNINKTQSFDTDKFGHIFNKNLNCDDLYNINEILNEHKQTKNSKDILAGITKRVVLTDTEHLKKLNNNFIRKYNSIDKSNDEKGHIMEPLDLMSNYENFKFRRSNQNKIVRESEYNQLLECLSKNF